MTTTLLSFPPPSIWFNLILPFYCAYYFVNSISHLFCLYFILIKFINVTFTVFLLLLSYREIGFCMYVPTRFKNPLNVSFEVLNHSCLWQSASCEVYMSKIICQTKQNYLDIYHIYFSIYLSWNIMFNEISQFIF